MLGYDANVATIGDLDRSNLFGLKMNVSKKQLSVPNAVVFVINAFVFVITYKREAVEHKGTMRERKREMN